MLLQQVDELNPDLLEPQLEILSGLLPQQYIQPLINSLHQYEFEQLKQQLLKLAKNVNVDDYGKGMTDEKDSGRR